MEQLLAVDSAGIKRSEQIEGFLEPDLVGKIGGLQTDTDAVFQPVFLRIRIEAQHSDITGGARPQALEYFNDRRFPRAIGPEQTENFAGRYFEIDAFDGLQARIGFAETPDRDRTGAGHVEAGRFAVTLLNDFILICLQPLSHTAPGFDSREVRIIEVKEQAYGSRPSLP